MIIARCENFKNEQKKLKKHYKEQRNLELILNHIKICQSFQELSTSPISYMYGFEALKYELSGYYVLIYVEKVVLFG